MAQTATKRARAVPANNKGASGASTDRALRGSALGHLWRHRPGPSAPWLA
jgi:hypothetical protein